MADLGGDEGDASPHQPKPNDFGRKISLNFGEDLFFFFWRPPDFGRKKRLNFRFFGRKIGQKIGRKISLNFGEDPFFFFFWRPPDFGRKKPLNFSAFREISFQFSDKLIQEQWKFGSRSFALFSLFQKSPPFPNPGYALGSTPRPLKQPLHCKFLTTHLVTTHPNFWGFVLKIFIIPPTKIFWIPHWG